MLLLETVKVGLFMKHVYNWAYIQCSAKGWYTEYTVPHKPHILRFIFVHRFISTHILKIDQEMSKDYLPISVTLLIAPIVYNILHI